MRDAPFVLALGDSLTAGYGLPPQHGFTARLEALLHAHGRHARVHNGGVSGDTSADGLARLPRLLEALPHTPDLAIVELGANDLLQLRDPGAMRADLDAILTRLAAAGVPALLTGIEAPAFLGGYARAYNAVFPALAAAHRIPLHPFFPAGMVGDPALTLPDRIHPNARAVAIVAANILPRVVAALDRREAA